jgi:cytochrome c-type biogenesis protein CcmE
MAVGAHTVGRSRTRFYLGGVVIVGSILYLLYMGLQNAPVYYVTTSELQQGAGAIATGQMVRVAGKVVPGSIQKGPDAFTARFSISDGAGTIPVYYKGALPDVFQEGIEVVVEGRYSQGGVFEARTVLAKCPSKFESANSGQGGNGQ